MVILLGVVALGVWAGTKVYRRKHSGEVRFWDLVLYATLLPLLAHRRGLGEYLVHPRPATPPLKNATYEGAFRGRAAQREEKRRRDTYVKAVKRLAEATAAFRDAYERVSDMESKLWGPNRPGDSPIFQN